LRLQFNEDLTNIWYIYYCIKVLYNGRSIGKLLSAHF